MSYFELYVTHIVDVCMETTVYNYPVGDLLDKKMDHLVSKVE
jgi:hypothetical protein